MLCCAVPPADIRVVEVHHEAKAGHFHQFHTYHDVGGDYVGIVADRFDEEHLRRKAKLS